MFEKKTNGLNPNILLGIIVMLLLIIALMGGFFIGQSYSESGSFLNCLFAKKVQIKVLTDKRDNTSDVTPILDQLKQIQSLSCSRFNVIDFNDAGVADYMKENDIKYLPSIIFPTKEIDISKDSLDGNGAKITDYLQELKGGEYELPIGATYDPFVERSEKGFKLLIREQYDKIQSLGNYVDGNKDAKITWLEFSDLQCPYCAQIYSAGTPTTLKEKYGDKLNIKFNSFPLSFHPVAKPASEFAECLAEQKGDEAFYNFIEKTFAENNKLNISSPFSDTERQILLDIALGLGADEDSLTACVNENRYDSKIDNQAFIGEELFGITGTPGNVIINNETLEYEQIQGLASASSFEQIIDKMLE